MEGTVQERQPNTRGRRAQAAVLSAATQLFAERGFAGTSIADIADAAQVAKPSVLYHFPDKDSLWRACVDTLWNEVDDFYTERWPTRMRPSRALMERILELFVEAALRWPAYVRIPFIEGATPSWRSEWLVEKHFKTHVLTNDRILRACQERGLLRTGTAVQAQLVLTSGINVVVAQAAMWSSAFETRVDAHAFLDDYVTHLLDLTFRSKSLDKD